MRCLPLRVEIVRASQRLSLSRTRQTALFLLGLSPLAGSATSSDLSCLPRQKHSPPFSLSEATVVWKLSFQGAGAYLILFIWQSFQSGERLRPLGTAGHGSGITRGESVRSRELRSDRLYSLLQSFTFSSCSARLDP